VQPRVDVDRDGTWSVQIYVGENADSNNGEHFKIKAVANPIAKLAEADHPDDWPKGEAESRIVEVVKR